MILLFHPWSRRPIHFATLVHLRVCVCAGVCEDIGLLAPRPRAACAKTQICLCLAIGLLHIFRRTEDSSKEVGGSKESELN
jgi:hypothetical protein